MYNHVKWITFYIKTMSVNVILIIKSKNCLFELQLDWYLLGIISKIWLFLRDFSAKIAV